MQINCNRKLKSKSLTTSVHEARLPRSTCLSSDDKLTKAHIVPVNRNLELPIQRQHQQKHVFHSQVRIATCVGRIRWLSRMAAKSRNDDDKRTIIVKISPLEAQISAAVFVHWRPLELDMQIAIIMIVIIQCSSSFLIVRAKG